VICVDKVELVAVAVASFILGATTTAISWRLVRR